MDSRLVPVDEMTDAMIDAFNAETPYVWRRMMDKSGWEVVEFKDEEPVKIHKFTDKDTAETYHDWLVIQHRYRAMLSAAPPVEGGQAVAEVVRTAPKRIWLQVSDEDGHENEPFPIHEEITWCQDSVTACEVEYVRADLSRPADSEALELLREARHWLNNVSDRCDMPEDLTDRIDAHLKGRT